MLDVTKKPSPAPASIPFDAERLDRLMDEAGIDVLCASSKHNVQYLLGGHRAFFFESMDAMGLSRYLPVLIYPKGNLQKAGYFGHRMEGFQKENAPFWVGEAQTNSSGTLDTMAKAIDHMRRAGIRTARIGAELSFLPVDAGNALRKAFPDSEIVDAVFVLERLRAVKSPAELAQLRIASEGVIDSMLAVISKHGPGASKRELTEALRREETSRGLTFDYCLITAGTSLNRAPSEQKWEKGDILSLDSGGNYKGYIGDLCRMGILGEPDAELEDLLGVIAEIQAQARRPIRRGAQGGEIFAAALAVVENSPHRPYLDFLAHGMGLVSHEAPRLTSTGPVPYSAYDATRGLESDMVISVETTMHHPKRGFIKLEDTVVVTDQGCEGFGDAGRGWNRTMAR
jgi:Xaa-Pro aminopeptidase